MRPQLFEDCNTDGSYVKILLWGSYVKDSIAELICERILLCRGRGHSSGGGGGVFGNSETRGNRNENSGRMARVFISISGATYLD